jgi:hypothetical protein
VNPHYDFSKAERGKFYRPDAVCHFPVYLEPDVEEFIRQSKDEVSAIVKFWRCSK